MQKWEYLKVVCSQTNDNKAKIIELNGKRVFDDSKNPINVHDYLNQLGKDGWELVNFEGWVYFFKRPLE